MLFWACVYLVWRALVFTFHVLAWTVATIMGFFCAFGMIAFFSLYVSRDDGVQRTLPLFPVHAAPKGAALATTKG